MERLRYFSNGKSSAGENDEAIRRRAAQADNRYQNCSERAANKLFATGYG